MIRRCITAVAVIAALISGQFAAGRDAGWNAALKQLDDDHYSVREAATEKLVTAGPEAIPHLTRLVEQGSPEAAWRASVILERMALEGDEAALKAVKTAVDGLIKSSRPGLARLGAELAERQKFFRHERAIAQIERLGGRVAVNGEEGGEEIDPAFDPFGGMGVIDIDGVDVFDGDDMEVEAPLTEVERLEMEAAGFDPIEVTFLDKFKEAAAEALLPPGDELPLGLLDVVEAELEEEGIPLVDEVEADRAIEVDVADDLMVAVDLDEEGEEVLATTVLLSKNWLGGDASVELLRDVRMLTTVKLDHAPLTDKALASIVRLPLLTELSIRGGKFSPAALRKLHREKPDVTLTVTGTAMIGVSTSGSPCTVQRVVPGSGADKAGLRAGDVILNVDEEPVEEFSDLSYALYARKPGDKVKVRFEREGKKQEVEATLSPRAGQ